MHYIFPVHGSDDDPTWHVGSVRNEEIRFLERSVFPHLRPITLEEYRNGFAAILSTMARFRYVLRNDRLYWCIEWQPGLIVLELSQEGRIRAAALRSPVPNFGGRKPLPIDREDYDEQLAQRFYRLVFDSWDAQFDDYYRKRMNAKAASPADLEVFRACLAQVNAVGKELQTMFSDSEKTREWMDKTQSWIADWAGTGVVLWR